jgi:hypothetical protein
MLMCTADGVFNSRSYGSFCGLMIADRCRVAVEFSLEEPKGGVHFVIPEGEGSLADRVGNVIKSSPFKPNFYLYH